MPVCGDITARCFYADIVRIVCRHVRIEPHHYDHDLKLIRCDEE